jgi:predicted short-subunit dehydrogenase-like oxidoreductase (DUF2520 family)
VRHLLSSAAANLAGGDTALALTGPVVRGDVDTVRRHVRALGGTPDVLALYAALSAVALDLARAAGADGAALAAIDGVLADAERATGAR